jgi:hypothetical protein
MCIECIFLVHRGGRFPVSPHCGHGALKSLAAEGESASVEVLQDGVLYVRTATRGATSSPPVDVVQAAAAPWGVLAAQSGADNHVIPTARL